MGIYDFAQISVAKTKIFSESYFETKKAIRYLNKRARKVNKTEIEIEIKTNSKTFSSSTTSRLRWVKTGRDFEWNFRTKNDGDLRESRGCCCTRRHRRRHRCCCCCRRRRCTSSREGKWSRQSWPKIFCTWNKSLLKWTILLCSSRVKLAM